MKTFVVKKREQFRKWLGKNHDKETKVGLLLYKRHTGKPAPTHRELMEEAICFGWIDTTVKRVDDDTYIRTFVRRNKNSTWSNNTLSYGRELIKQGRMASSGMHFFKLGKAKPTHDHDVPKNPSMPLELKKALAKSKKLQKAFDTYPPSHKKMWYRWLWSAKRDETKEKRIRAILEDVKNKHNGKTRDRNKSNR